MMKKSILFLLFCILISCQSKKSIPVDKIAPFYWGNATVYFLLTDRFYNGNPDNDLPFNRQRDGGLLRNFEGGDMAGVTKKIKEGYFNNLGVNAIWLTPLVEQIHSFTNEGTGKTYGYHGYWTRDWTSLDPNFGTADELREMVDAAHEHGIRVLMDVVINHTGPVTGIDSQWPGEWVRTGPRCTYRDAETTIACTLVDNLPDIRTEYDSKVNLPPFLVKKWQSENRYEREIQELEEFFQSTGYPRAPRYYIMKWLSDWVREFGIDGFRVDTAKHTEASIWKELQVLVSRALEDWKKENPKKKIDDEPFFMTGEVYGYGLDGGRAYHYNETDSVDFFEVGFHSLINFSFKYHANNSYEELFDRISTQLQADQMEGLSVLNYLSSHDDGNPFDRDRNRGREAALKLLLAPGSPQIYYGDETNRPLRVTDARGDANLRSKMNWEDLDEDAKEIHQHWAKLGKFRLAHPAIGLGEHTMLSDEPYAFKREFVDGEYKDKVLVYIELEPSSPKSLDVFEVFENGELVKDYYSGKSTKVRRGKINLDTEYEIVLLGKD